MWPAVTAAQSTGQPNDALLPLIFTFLGVVVVTLGPIGVEAIRSRNSERTAPSPPAPVPDAGPPGTAERLAVLEYQARESQLRDDDADQRDDLQDRALHGYGERIEALERYNDRRDPGWRR